MNITPPKFNFIILIRLTLLLGLIAVRDLHAQPQKNWDKTLGGSRYEELNGLVVVADGIVIGGSTNSNADFGFPNDTSFNFLLYKLDFSGNIIWKQIFPTEKTDRLWSLIATSDGGFLAGGYSYSDAGAFKTDNNRGDMDVWVMKLDALGNKIWDKTFGGSARDEMFAALELPQQAGYLLGCHSKSGRGSDKSHEHRGAQDFWLLKIDLNGNLIWDKTIGGEGREQFTNMAFTADGNVVLAGTTASKPNSFEVGSDFARGGQDFWLVKIDPHDGSIIWNKRYGGTSEDVAYSVCVQQSGNILLGGRSVSSPAPPTTANNGKDAPFYGGSSDYWVVQTDANGRKLKDWSFGGTGLDDLYFIKEDVWGNLYLGGVSDSDRSGSKTTQRKGGYDFWLLSLTKTGDIRWERTIGGAKSDAMTKIALCPQGSIIVGGHSMSDAGLDKSDNSKGLNDFWVVNFCCNLDPRISMLGDSTPCSGEPVTLEVRTPGCPDCTYLWSTGETGRNIEVAPGTRDTFTVTLVNSAGCYAQKSKFIDLPAAPTLDLGLRDTVVFEYQTITIGSNNPHLQYKWNTGDTTASIVVSYAGVYALTVTDAHGCSATDWMNIRVVKRSHLFVPNIFTPDFDGLNDYLNVYADKSVRRIVSFQVADRWGTVYFSRKNFYPNYENDGWDGTFDGRRVPPGLYTWASQVEYLDGKVGFEGGSVLLIR